MFTFLVSVCFFIVVFLTPLLFIILRRRGLSNNEKMLIAIPVFGFIFVMAEFFLEKEKWKYTKTKHIERKYFTKDNVFKGDMDRALSGIAKKEIKEKGEVGKSFYLMKRILDYYPKYQISYSNVSSFGELLKEMQKKQAFLEENYTDEVITHLLISHQKILFMLWVELNSVHQWRIKEGHGKMEYEVQNGFKTLVEVFLKAVNEREMTMKRLGLTKRQLEEQKKKESKKGLVEELNQEMEYQQYVMNPNTYAKMKLDFEKEVKTKNSQL